MGRELVVYMGRERKHVRNKLHVIRKKYLYAREQKMQEAIVVTACDVLSYMIHVQLVTNLHNNYYYICYYINFIMVSLILFIMQYKDDDIKLNQLLCVCDMLATCAEGHNTFGEDLCQSIFTLEDLIKLV